MGKQQTFKSAFLRLLVTITGHILALLAAIFLAIVYLNPAENTALFVGVIIIAALVFAGLLTLSIRATITRVPPKDLPRYATWEPLNNIKVGRRNYVIFLVVTILSLNASMGAALTLIDVREHPYLFIAVALAIIAIFCLIFVMGLRYFNALNRSS